MGWNPCKNDNFYPWHNGCNPCTEIDKNPSILLPHFLGNPEDIAPRSNPCLNSDAAIRLQSLS